MTDIADKGASLSLLPPEIISRDHGRIACARSSYPLLAPGRLPEGILYPRDSKELKEIVRIANASGLNLTVTSSSGPHCKGGFNAEQKHLLIDLSPWKGIDWINRRNRVCMIQPGVTYKELLAALEPEGMTLSMPLAPRSGKSVLAAVSDREPSTWPNKQWDLTDPVASTEFIFGGGRLFRTGAAGGPGTLAHQRAAGGAQKSPLGPSQADLHRVVMGAQGTMGILTWITLRTELKPTLQKPFLISAENLEELTPFVYDVQRPWLGEHTFILNRTALTLLLAAGGRRSIEDIRDDFPAFVCLQNIVGFERLAKKRVQYQEKDIRDIARRYGLTMAQAFGEIKAADVLRIATRPCGDIDWRHQLKGHCLSLFFMTTLDRAPLYHKIMSDLKKKFALDDTPMGIYIQPVVQNHGCHMEFMLPFDPDNDKEVALMKKYEAAAMNKLIAAKAYFSRPYGPLQENVFHQNRMNLSVLKKIKHIFDPNRILNRGKWEFEVPPEPAERTAV